MLVKCAECGLVALRGNESRQLVEMEQKLRGPTHSAEAINLPEEYEMVPLCVARKRKFGVGHDRIVEMRTDFDCNRFVQYQPGFSPKDHAQMDMVERQQKWQTKITLTCAFGGAVIAGLFAIAGACVGAWITNTAK